MKRRYVILLVVISILVLGAFLAYNKVYSWVFDSNTSIETSYHLYIESDTSFNYVASVFKRDSVLENSESFTAVAKRKKAEKVRSGHYTIESGMSNNAIINMLRSGWQTPVKLTFIAQSNLKKLSSVLANQMVFDSASFYQYLVGDFREKYDIKQELLPAYFIPNTYEVYWNLSEEKLADRLYKEYVSFWNSKRVELAGKKGLSPTEVSTLASIVEGETNKVDEMPRVAGLYLNRIKKGMKLESDPTIRYCIKQKNGEDYAVKRVLNADLKIDSPYNTYMYKGLPPGPLSIPSLQAINAVLNAESNNYIFMCADPETGYHNFTSSYNEHLRNRKKYTDWLRKNNISR